jgi:hypothetical protein
VKGNARATARGGGHTCCCLIVDGAGAGFPGHIERQNRAMAIIRVAIAIIWVVSFLAGRQVWDARRPSGNTATSAEITDSRAPVSGAVAGEPRVETGDPIEPPVPQFDLFGNEIEDAVADYRIDLRGGVYERHSPDTAVPKRKPPTT